MAAGVARTAARPRSRPAATAFAATALAFVATPLVPRGRRRLLSSAVVAGLASTTAALAVRRWGRASTATAAAVVAGATTAVEVIGSRTGIPFGRYAYTGALRPSLAGVPAVVPLAWFAMALPAREVGRASGWGSVAGGALALVAWDVFLDPQMVAEGYWTWARRGRYRGIPASNFLGWALTAAGLMVVLDRLLPAGAGAAAGAGPAPERALAGLYLFVAVMETIGFAVFFGDPVVAVAGGLAMAAPIAAGWWRQRRG